jgi:hypothetical protein
MPWWENKKSSQENTTNIFELGDKASEICFLKFAKGIRVS